MVLFWDRKSCGLKFRFDCYELVYRLIVVLVVVWKLMMILLL